MSARTDTAPAGAAAPPVERRGGVRPPGPPLAALAAILVVALVGVGAVRFTGIGPTQPVPAAAVERVDLRFHDRDDGGIDIVDAGSRRVIDVVAPGTNGFLRSAMRGLARERRLRGLGDDAPFTLARDVGGHLTLTDPTTARIIDLGSFGRSNAAVFANLLRPDTRSNPGTKP